MKALVIAPQPFFSPRGTPFSVYYRTLVMVQFGVQVDLLTFGHSQRRRNDHGSGVQHRTPVQIIHLHNVR